MFTNSKFLLAKIMNLPESLATVIFVLILLHPLSLWPLQENVSTEMLYIKMM